jgi:hypothetical protein
MDPADSTDLDDAYLVTFGHHPDIDVDQISPFRIPPGPGRRWLLLRRGLTVGPMDWTDEENEQLKTEAKIFEEASEQLEARTRPPDI